MASSDPLSVLADHWTPELSPSELFVSTTSLLLGLPLDESNPVGAFGGLFELI
jgi:hypothetical protein